MEFELMVNVAPELGELGACRRLAGTLALDGFIYAGCAVQLEDGIEYEVALSNTGEAITLTGQARAAATTDCHRCLEPAALELAGEVEGYFMFEAAEEVEGMEPDEFAAIGADGSFNIADNVLAAITNDLPQVVLCHEDCAGLCQHCGANLNVEECTCAADYIDPMNPFAALAAFKDDEES